MNPNRISFTPLGNIPLAPGSTENDPATELSPAATSIAAAEASPSDRGIRVQRCDQKIDRDKSAQPQGRTQEAQSTDFELLADGSLLELVTDGQHSRGLRFLHWSDSGSRFAESVECGGKIFTPPVLHPSLIRAVRLPAGTSPSGDSRHPFYRIADLVQEFLDLPEHMLARVASFALSTWFPECLNVAPLLWITGPPMSGKTTLLTLLHCLCRRPVLLTDMTPAGLYSLQDALKPTLLIDEGELSKGDSDQRVMRLLRAGSTRGIQVIRRQQVFDCFGPKAIAARMWPDDEALATRAVFVTMLPTRRSLPAFNPHLIRDRIDDLQSELMYFRLTNYHRVRMPELPRASDLNPRLLQIARALTAPLQNDDLLEERLVCSLREQDQEADCVRHDQPEYLVVEALFDLSHKQQVGEMGVQHITDAVNRHLMGQGDDRSFKPRRIGAILKALGIHTERLGNWGRGIRISYRYRRQVHGLAQQFGITQRDVTSWMAVKAGYGGPPCQLCTEFDLNAGLRFVPIKPIKRRTRRWFHEPDERANRSGEAQNSVNHNGEGVKSERDG